MLPVKVKPPITTVRNIGIRIPKLSVLDKRNSDDPTSKLAIPPKPLKIATISGIDVISILRAAIAPIDAPKNMATKIHWKLVTLWSNKVTTTATNMPRAEIRLPLAAVSGEPNIFNPIIKSAEENI